MNIGVRQSIQAPSGDLRLSENMGRRNVEVVACQASACSPLELVSRKVRVQVMSEDRLRQDNLSCLLAKHPGLEVLGLRAAEIFRPEMLPENLPDLLLLTSLGNLDEDISLIRKIRITVPSVRIVMFGGVGEESEFLQFVRAGIRGYLLPDASAEDVVEALVSVQAGKAFCPGSLCGFLFRYFEVEATTLPSAAVRQRLGLTRREQQLIPLIAQGLTNKEIANHFCLSEQTVKNHLYRMKYKVGADNRLGIVRTCHTQGFLL